MSELRRLSDGKLCAAEMPRVTRYEEIVAPPTWVLPSGARRYHEFERLSADALIDPKTLPQLDAVPDGARALVSVPRVTDGRRHEETYPTTLGDVRRQVHHLHRNGAWAVVSWAQLEAPPGILAVALNRLEFEELEAVTGTSR